MDPFATLGLARAFDLDVDAVARVHRDLSRALHPDRHAGGGATERLTALQRAVEVNEAWRIVRDPIRRAEALFALAGVAVGETHEPKPTNAFLMDMLEQRESLAEAKSSKDAAAVSALAAGITARVTATDHALRDGFAAAKGDAKKLAALVGSLGELRFYRRFLDEVSAIEDELEDGPHAARDL